MNREKLIREMIQIELLYQTRQKILRETKAKKIAITRAVNAGNKQNTQPTTGITNTYDFKNIFKYGNKNIDAANLYSIIKNTNNTALNDNFIKDLKNFYQDKGLKDSQITTIVEDITKGIVMFEGKPVTQTIGEYYCQSLIDFPFNKFSLGKKLIDNLISTLNENKFLEYLNSNNKKSAMKQPSFHYDIFNNVSKPDHPMGPGKAEFLILSLVAGTTSGGFKDHDIVFFDITTGNKRSELEIKQGASKEEDFRFNINIKRNSDASRKRSEFLKKLNSFYKKFISSTQEINKLLDVTGIYESEYIKRNFIEETKTGYSYKDVSKDFLNYLDSTASDDQDQKYTEKDQKYKMGMILGYLLDHQIDIKPGSTIDSSTISNETTGAKKRGQKYQGQQNLQNTYKLGRAENVFNLKNITKDFLSGRNQTFSKDLENYSVVFDHETPGDFKSKPAISVIYDPNGTTDTYTDLEEIFNLIKGKVNAETPFNLQGEQTSATASTLSLWTNSYFDFIVKKYVDLLKFYENMLIKIKEYQNNTQNANKDQEIKDALAGFSPKENIPWDQWDLFLKIYRGLDLGNKEVAMDFKYYDNEGRLIKKKHIVNIVGDEFNIIEPNNTDVDAFFDSTQDREYKLELKNEDISEEEFENIMSTKEAFRFLNDLNNSLTKSTNTTVSNITNVSNKQNQIVKENKGISELLDEVIDALIELHQQIFNDYVSNNQIGAEGILYATTNTDKTVLNFKKPFSKKNPIQFKIMNNKKDFEDFMTKNTFSAQLPNTSTIPLIKDIYPNEKVLWCNHSDSNESLLSVLINIKEKLISQGGYIEQIKTKVVNIQNEINEIKNKAQGTKKLSNIDVIKNPTQRQQINFTI